MGSFWDPEPKGPIGFDVTDKVRSVGVRTQQQADMKKLCALLVMLGPTKLADQAIRVRMAATTVGAKLSDDWQSGQMPAFDEVMHEFALLARRYTK
jgi:hypothetical protein